MGAQAFTKSLRDRKIPIQQRAQSVFDLFDGKLSVYLPRKEIVLLEWAFTALTMEATARSSQDIWTILLLTWSACSTETQKRVFQTFKFTNILIETFKSMPDAECLLAVEKTIQLVCRSVTLITSESQAGVLVHAYLAAVGPKPHPATVLNTLRSQLEAHKHIFKGFPDALWALTSSGIEGESVDYFLGDYFSVPNIDFEKSINEQKLGPIMKGIVRSSVQVHERFHILTKSYPHNVDALLQACPNSLKLSNEDIGHLTISQAEISKWDSLRVLISMNATATLSHVDAILAALDKYFNVSFAVYLIQKATQNRQFAEFLKKWGEFAIKNNDWTAPLVLDQISSSLDSLSASQLERVLQEVKKSSLPYLLGRLSFRAGMALNVREILRRLARNPQYAFPILSLWPQLIRDDSELVEDIKSGIASKEAVTIDDLASLLTLRENHIPVDFISSLDRWTGSDNAANLIARFYKVLDASSVATISKHVKVNDFAIIFQGRDIYEYPKVVAACIHAFLDHDSHISILNLVLFEGVDRAAKTECLKKAWEQRELPLIIKALHTPPRSTDFETQPRYLLGLAKSLEEEECQQLITITKLLCRHQGYEQRLKEELSIDRFWHTQCIAAVVYGSTEPAGPQLRDLISILEANFSKKESIVPSIAALAYIVDHATDVEQLSINQGIVGSLLSTSHFQEIAGDLFQILTNISKDWLSVTAFFIFTGLKFRNTFDSFLQRMSKEDIEELVKLCLREKEFEILQLVFLATDLRFLEHYLTKNLTFIWQTLFAYPNTLNEHQLLSLYNLMAHILKDNPWVISQYTLETLITVICKIYSQDFLVPIENVTDLYMSHCLVLGRCLIFQRYRLVNRNHLVVSALSSLLKCLSGARLSEEFREKIAKFPPFLENNKSLCTDASAADTLLRAIVSLCDPPQQSVREGSGKNKLTSSVARTRRYVAKNVPTLFLNYIHLALQNGFDASIHHHIDQMAYTILDVLSAEEVKALTATLDSAGRSYAKTVYDNYASQGKWKKD